MTLNRRKKHSHEDTSALSDLAFLLIIYFIVIAGFNINKGFLLTLPAKDSTRMVLREELLRFELAPDGALVFQGEAVDAAFAEQAIGQGIAARPNLAVVLTIAPECPWQQVVAFVELAERLQVDSFSFTMQKNSALSAGGL